MTLVFNDTFTEEVLAGDRFSFGKNWANFLKNLNEERIKVAEESLKSIFLHENFTNKNIIDIGSGSGLFSLAFKRLGANVTSFDYDPDSVSCTQYLKDKFYKGNETWKVLRGSVLDKSFINTLGKFDIVYSWGVLHHTGKMWEAIDNASHCVKDNGLLLIGIYRDMGTASKLWVKVKRLYCSSLLGKLVVLFTFIPYYILRGVIVDLFLRFKSPLSRYREYKKNRGMSLYHDWIDWLGGYPYEFAKPEELFHFLKSRGFQMINIKTEGMLELVFRKNLHN